VNFTGVYWILNGIVTFQWAWRAEGPRRRLPLAAIWTADRHDSLSTWLASAWALLGGVVLVSDAVLMRRRLLAHPDDPAGSTSEVAE
jgi:hypothetical protein